MGILGFTGCAAEKSASMVAICAVSICLILFSILMPMKNEHSCYPLIILYQKIGRIEISNGNSLCGYARGFTKI